VTTGADAKAGKYIKDLMVGSRYVSDLNKYAGQCRLSYNERTLPWDDMGDRLLPTSMLLDFKKNFNGKRDEFFRMRDYICGNYDALKRVSANYLGAMANAGDYPTVEEVYKKYSWKLTMKTVPESGHLLLDLPAQDLEEMRAALEQENADKTKNAMDAAWHKMHDMLTGMSSKLVEADGDSKKRFYDSFVTNPRELCSLLGHLNVTGDPELESARVMLERTMQGADIDILKESPTVRENMKAKVDAIINQFEW
tara:strand:+ start:1103 stop:1861 length:759 start_codon:yes stop_codon:yes gene_type:complete